MGTTSRELTNLGASSISFDIPTAAVASYFLDIAAQGYTITEARIYTDSGTCTVTFYTRAIGEGGLGTAITGLSSLSVNSTATNYTATANNVIAANEELILDVSANSSALHLRGYLKVQRG